MTQKLWQRILKVPARNSHIAAVGKIIKYPCPLFYFVAGFKKTKIFLISIFIFLFHHYALHQIVFTALWEENNGLWNAVALVCFSAGVTSDKLLSLLWFLHTCQPKEPGRWFLVSCFVSGLEYPSRKWDIWIFLFLPRTEWINFFSILEVEETSAII